MGPMKRKTVRRNSAVSPRMTEKPVENTVSGFSRSSLAKRNSVVSIPKVRMTNISAV